MTFLNCGEASGVAMYTGQWSSDVLTLSPSMDERRFMELLLPLVTFFLIGCRGMYVSGSPGVFLTLLSDSFSCRVITPGLVY